MYLQLHLLLIVSYYTYFTYCIQCVDENNNPVDWFIVYKLPHFKHDHGELFRHGVAYTYITSNEVAWKLSALSINDTKSILALTLTSLYNNNNTNNIHILYNDEPPDRRTINNKGHTKGVVLGDETGGIWLIHSVPHFPKPGPFYTYPTTGSIYGQSAICISLDLNNLNNVGLQLQYNEPEIYLQNIPKKLLAKVPDLVSAANNVTIKSAPWFHSMILSSKNGVAFESYAKSQHFGKDLYEDWLAPALNSSLFVETWTNGRGVLPSNCSEKFKVINIKSITMISANVTFTSSDDHSKWAVTKPSENVGWICIGDINRMQSQKNRGGGTVCFSDKKVVSNYQKCIATIENC